MNENENNNVEEIIQTEDITAEYKKLIVDEDSTEEEDNTPKRKAAPINAAAETVGDKVTRKAGTLPKYNVVVTTK